MGQYYFISCVYSTVSLNWLSTAVFRGLIESVKFILIIDVLVMSALVL